MNAELQMVANRLDEACSPEDIFGMLPGRGGERLVNLKILYHRLAKITHPDVYPAGEDKSTAQAAFSRLSAWFASAQAKLQAGTYGQPGDHQAVMIETKKRVYQLGSSHTQGPVYNRYPCTYTQDGRTRKAIIKLVRNPQDNDLAENEARVLGLLRAGKGSPKFGPYLPRLLDSFLYHQAGIARQATVFDHRNGWYSLEEVQMAYPNGIDPKDMAWIFRRVLVALGFAHLNGVIHGAVLPSNILILPEQHGLMLEEFSYAVFDGSPWANIPAVDLAYVSWYPVEVQRKLAPAPGTDIGMAARCMMYLMAAGPTGESWPASVPYFIRSFFKGCTLPAKSARPQDAWALKEEFDDLLEKHWGKRKFHPFSMPVHS